MTKHFNNDFVKVFILNVFYESPFEKKFSLKLQILKPFILKELTLAFVLSMLVFFLRTDGSQNLISIFLM